MRGIELARSCARRASDSAPRRAGREPGRSRRRRRRARRRRRRSTPSARGAVEVDDHQHRAVAAALGVAEELLVVGRRETSARLSCSAGFSRRMRLTQARSASPGCLARSRSQARSWYFSLSTYSSAPGRGDVLHELEGRPVDAVVASTASPRAPAAARTRAARRTASLRAGCRACWARSWAGRSRRPAAGVSSARYSVNSDLACRQVKYVYDCVNPPLASAYITFGRVKASARKIVSG